MPASELLHKRPGCLKVQHKTLMGNDEWRRCLYCRWWGATRVLMMGASGGQATLHVSTMTFRHAECVSGMLGCCRRACSIVFSLSGPTILVSRAIIGSVMPLITCVGMPGFCTQGSKCECEPGLQLYVKVKKGGAPVAAQRPRFAGASFCFL